MKCLTQDQPHKRKKRPRRQSVSTSPGSLQVSAQQDAVSLFQRYGKESDNSGLKAFANEHLPHLQEHLKMAQNLDK